VAVDRLALGVGARLLGAGPLAMLSEEALMLYALFVGLGLLALGLWEQVSPARSRRPGRPAPPERERTRGRDGD
jgi:hypothetical protein